MMKTVLFILLILPFTQIIAQKEPDAEIYLDRIASDLDPGHALTLKFEYIRQDQQDGSELEGEGTLILMGEKYKIEIDEAVIYFDGVKQYSYQKEIEEVYVSVPDPEDREFMFSDPVRLLRNYADYFKYRIAGEGMMNGNPVKEIQLYPEELGSPYALIKLFFSTGDSKLKQIVIRQKDGILYTMTIMEMKKTADPGTDFFRFNPKEFPEADVIELLN